MLGDNYLFVCQAHSFRRANDLFLCESNLSADVRNLELTFSYAAYRPILTINPLWLDADLATESHLERHVR
jgi:hypothetical protein